MTSNDNPLRQIKLLRTEIPSWEDYPFSVGTIKSFTQLDIHHNLIYFIGENGSGKSTLLEAIALNYGFGKEGGSKNIQHSTSDNASTNNLADHLKLIWNQKPLKGFFLRSESFFNIGTFLDERSKEPFGERAYDGYEGISPHQRSHGELFLTIFKNQFYKKGFYILDEPEAALSPQKQLSFLIILHQLIKDNPNIQFIIATHSPIILSYPNCQIFSFDNGTITETKYEETEIYKIPSDFLKNPKVFYHKLLR